MRLLIAGVRSDFPLNEPDANICGISSVVSPKKRLEIVDTELCQWQVKLDEKVTPKLGDISRLCKL
ncbi:hypothetical protein [Litorilituus sediminis]|uniref:Uncharacterized protein n=1 Tax=Litorilituus sediminis TaxID=718192 RepID=A0A4P6P5P2_9GAMM|nr:hypothetical protein [Litorilituus sediminis]QBG36891.1 hypothetical protein EMK97_14765 [Litorilituus sediminis]